MFDISNIPPQAILDVLLFVLFTLVLAASTGGKKKQEENYDFSKWTKKD